MLPSYLRESAIEIPQEIEFPKQRSLQLVVDNTGLCVDKAISIDNSFTLGTLKGVDRLEFMARYMVAALAEGRSPALLQSLARSRLGDTI